MSICLEEPRVTRNYAHSVKGGTALWAEEPRAEYCVSHTIASDKEADAAAARALTKHIKAFEELSKR